MCVSPPLLRAISKLVTKERPSEADLLLSSGLLVIDGNTYGIDGNMYGIDGNTYGIDGNMYG